MNDTMTSDADSVLAGLSIVDCGAHFSEPPDLWTARAPQSIKARWAGKSRARDDRTCLGSAS